MSAFQDLEVNDIIQDDFDPQIDRNQTDDFSCPTISPDDTTAASEIDKTERSFIHLNTSVFLPDSQIFGITFLGRQHQISQTPCQDYHQFVDLGDNWHLYIISDGAGSAKASHRGSKINCEVTAHLLAKMIKEIGWKDRNELPDDIEWHMQFLSLCRFVRSFIEEKVENLDEDVSPKDFNATLLLLIVTPCGMLCGHIGDGRIGYKSTSDQWHSIITPHRGEEVNQTIFLMNPWDKIKFPALKISDVLVPETKVIREMPKAVCLLSDGCENFTWNCLQLDSSIGMYRDINTPFEPFWESMLQLLSDENKTADEINALLIEKIDIGNNACITEGDDRSLMIGIYNHPISSDETDNSH